MINEIPEQGDIVKVNFNPSKGHEQQGYRPAVVVSNDLLNTKSPFVWVVPITNGNWEFPTHVKLDSRTQTQGRIYVEQLLMIDFKNRKVKFIERLPEDQLDEVLMLISELTEKESNK
ncbi:MAG: type II toxin-antitoxin system PemK/MazF family toxin [Lactobacillaceae bacterium]